MNRKTLTEAFLTLYLLMEGDIPDDYLKLFHITFENGCESWLDLVPRIQFSEGDLGKVINYFSYVNPRFFPERGRIELIVFSEISGGKGRKCTKGIKLYEIPIQPQQGD